MTLYKLVIVEDEERIRCGLQYGIDWEELGFEVIGAFENGDSALEFIKCNHCDVVMTDIMMEKMTGLEMISELRKSNPVLKTVVLSGYDNFSYTRQAIQNKVEDYLLKPIDEEELYTVYLRIKKTLDDEYADDLREDTHEESKSSQDINGRCDMLIAALNMEDIDFIRIIVRDIMYECKDLSLIELKEVMKEIYSVIKANLKERKMDALTISNGKFVYENMLEKQEVTEIEEYLNESFVALCNGISVYEVEYDSRIVNSVKKYVEKHVFEELGNSIIADKFNTHPAYLCRIFKQCTGEGLADYILRTKMKKVAELLKTKKYTITDTAQSMGYSSLSYFSTQFKKYTGFTPSEYIIRVLE